MALNTTRGYDTIELENDQGVFSSQMRVLIKKRQMGVHVNIMIITQQVESTNNFCSSLTLGDYKVCVYCHSNLIFEAS